MPTHLKKNLLALLCSMAATGVFAQTADTSGSHDAKASFSVGVNRSTSSLFKGLTLQSKTGLLLDASYENGPWYASMQNGLGFKLVNNGVWTVAIAANYMPGRYVANDSRYAGMGDVPGTLAAYGWAEWRPVKDALTLYGNVSRSTRSGHGMLLTLGTTLGFPVMGKLHGFVDINWTWGNAAYNQTYYGVNAAQSASSPYALYSPAAGRISTNPSIGLVYSASDQWSVGGYVGRSLLSPMQSASPMAAGLSSQPLAAIFSTWKY